MRSYVLANNAAHYDGMIAALEARGLRVIPAFATGLDARPGDRALLLRRRRAHAIDAIVSLTGFSLVGGPAYNDAKAAEDILAKLDVPYLAVTPVEFQTLEQWQASERGLMPVESTMMVAIPELDGAIWPIVFGGRGAPQGPAPGCTHGLQVRERHPATTCARITERAEMLAARVGQARRAAPHGGRAERKIAVVLFNFPPNAGAAGTAAYLSVFASLHNTLRALQARGLCGRRAGRRRRAARAHRRRQRGALRRRRQRPCAHCRR